MGEIDDVELSRLIKADLEGTDLDLTGIDLEGLQEIGAVESTPIPDVQIDAGADNLKRLQEKWGTARGQLWELSEHRLLCADIEEKETIQRILCGTKVKMIFTDPPYGHKNNDGDLIQNREAALGKCKTASSQARPIANDGPEDAARLFTAFCRIASEVLEPGCCCCCCCCGGGPDPQFARWSLEIDAAIGFKHAVVWDKGGLGMGWHYRRNYEFVLVAEKPGAACHWFGGNDVPNIIRGIGKIIPSTDQHPTEKPADLAAWFLKLHSQEADLIFEPFCGSGSTLMACDSLKRICCATEIDPIFVGLALERWALATGGTPKLTATQ